MVSLTSSSSCLLRKKEPLGLAKFFERYKATCMMMGPFGGLNLAFSIHIILGFNLMNSISSSLTTLSQSHLVSSSCGKCQRRKNYRWQLLIHLKRTLLLKWTKKKITSIGDMRYMAWAFRKIKFISSSTMVLKIVSCHWPFALRITHHFQWAQKERVSHSVALNCFQGVIWWRWIVLLSIFW